MRMVSSRLPLTAASYSTVASSYINVALVGERGRVMSEIEARAREIAESARGMADRIDADRRLPAELVSDLRDSGLLRGGAPVEVDGLELAPGVALRCAEEVARGDASAGWCVSIAITSSLLIGYLPAVGRDELFGAGRGVASGVV